jgi:hypothetical protein
MDALRSALLELHNTSKPIENRFDAALQAVNGLGKGILSAVLLVIYPSEFGVWNRISEASLKLLDIWPEFDQGASSGKRYKAINDVLHQLKDRLGLDLWVLDSLLWAVTQGHWTKNFSTRLAIYLTLPFTPTPWSSN